MSVVGVGAAATAVGSGEQSGGLATLRRGLELSPLLKEGLGGTLALALVSTAGRCSPPA